MVALDTNVVVRFLMRDDNEQSKRAENLIENNLLFLSQTVLLEIEWVLRSSYQVSSSDINEKLQDFCSFERLTVEHENAVLDALEWHASGLDFADALHLASSRAADQFATFDSRLRKRALKLEGAIKVIEP
jgi:predicted nucleic-acid-binding protein